MFHLLIFCMTNYVAKQTEPEWSRWPPPGEQLEGQVSNRTIRFKVFRETLKKKSKTCCNISSLNELLKWCQ